MRMTKDFSKHPQLWQRLGISLLIFGTTISLHAAEVTATIEPNELSVGETAELSVTVNGSQSASPSLPAVDGLDFQSVGQSTQIQVINGAMSAQSTHTYVVTPERAGRFTIPAIQADGAKSTPLILRVLAGSGMTQPSRRSAQPPATALPPPNVNAAPSSVNAPADARFGFMQIVVPKKEFYVGELVPVEVNAFFPEGMQASITGLPTLSSEAFTLNQLDQKPAQAERMVNGQPYSVLTWHSAISAVKAGDYSLGAQMPATVVVRAQTRGSSGDPFDDFFNGPAFGLGGGEQKEVTLQSGPDAVKVLPLPTAGRPKDFSGGVGKFEVQATASTSKAAVGDPVALTLKISGAGNFDRLSSEMLPSDESWKTYKPKSSFAPADSAGFTGTKSFEQIVMPNDSSLTAIPALSFSFFNPETQQYVTRTTEPIPLAVSGTSAKKQPGAAAPAPQATPAAQDLVPNKNESGAMVSTLRPVFFDPWFALAPGIPVLAMIAALLYLRRKDKLATDPEFARATAADRAIRAQVDEMDQAMRHSEPLAFFDSARHALQARLGERWNVKPESITAAEISTRMNGDADGVRAVFEMADRHRFSGETFAKTDFRRWKKQVEQELQRLKAGRKGL
ncbi:MAG: BatD family protein [Verrucomicrobiota bacterium]|nr:BatD family protein [Verrucomicrobiota bacterium]